VLFHDHGHGEQDGRDGDFDDGPPRAFLLLVVVLVFMLVLVMMFVRVCHIACFLLSGHKDTGLPLQPGCKMAGLSPADTLRPGFSPRAAGNVFPAELSL
jgi:hypothetical protein